MWAHLAALGNVHLLRPPGGGAVQTPSPLPERGLDLGPVALRLTPPNTQAMFPHEILEYLGGGPARGATAIERPAGPFASLAPACPTHAEAFATPSPQPCGVKGRP